MEVTVVIPVHDEEEILRGSVVDLVSGLRRSEERFEILLAENGSSDATPDLVSELGREFAEVGGFSIPEPNYGRALREGIERARGRFVICEEIDLCDLAFHRTALELLRSGASDFVIGSKAMRGARDTRPWGRRVATRVYNRTLYWLLGFVGTDTHGLKAFRTDRVRPVVRACEVGHDVFASELVIRAQRSGVRVVEVPVAIREKRPPSVHLLRRVPRVLSHVFRLFVTIRLGVGGSEDPP